MMKALYKIVGREEAVDIITETNEGGVILLYIIEVLVRLVPYFLRNCDFYEFTCLFEFPDYLRSIFPRNIIETTIAQVMLSTWWQIRNVS